MVENSIYESKSKVFGFSLSQIKNDIFILYLVSQIESNALIQLDILN